ncbi:general secretion pathway protein GspH [Methylobacterium nodulans]|nr:general secretion pathway protein GspH [Methylobacterium nodulans]
MLSGPCRWYPQRPPARDPSGGFVLLELVLALTILSLIAALALPWARPFDGPARLGIKAHEIAVLLRRDRDAARRAQRSVSTEVDLLSRTVRSGAANGEVAVPSAFALRVVAPVIRFSPDGSASGGAIFLAGQQKGGIVAVAVDDLTGAVTVTRGERHAP